MIDLPLIRIAIIECKELCNRHTLRHHLKNSSLAATIGNKTIRAPRGVLENTGYCSKWHLVFIKERTIYIVDDNSSGPQINRFCLMHIASINVTSIVEQVMMWRQLAQDLIHQNVLIIIIALRLLINSSSIVRPSAPIHC